jgi:hypothetical protein
MEFMLLLWDDLDDWMAAVRHRLLQRQLEPTLRR